MSDIPTGIQRKWAEHVYVKGRVPSHPFPYTEEEAESYRRVLAEEHKATQADLKTKKRRLVEDVRSRLDQGHQITQDIAHSVLKYHSDEFSIEEQGKLRQHAQRFQVGDKLAARCLFSNRGTCFGVVTKVRANGMYTVLCVHAKRELVKESDDHHFKTYRDTPNWDMLKQKVTLTATCTSDSGTTFWKLYDPHKHYDFTDNNSQ